MARTAGKDPGVMKTKKTPRRHQRGAKSPQRLGQGSGKEWAPRPPNAQANGARKLKKSKTGESNAESDVHVGVSGAGAGNAEVSSIDEGVQPPTTSAAATGAPVTRKRKSTPEGEGGGPQRRRRAEKNKKATAAVPKHPTNAKRDAYRYHPANTTVMHCATLNGQLEDVDNRANIVREVGAVLDRLSGSDIELQPALRETWGIVARTLSDSAGLPEEVLPFFLHPRYESPRRGQSCALVGFMCPAHEDNVAFSGATGNRTVTLHRIIESAVVEMGHPESLCVNVNCFRCLKDGDGSYANPCVRDEEVTRLSQFALAIYFAALYAYGVKVTRIVQSCGSEDKAKGPFYLGPWGEHFPAAVHLLSLSITPISSSPHLTATKTDKSYHPGLAAKVAAQVIQARLGEEGSRLSVDGRVAFEALRVGTADAAFKGCPEDIGPPTRTSGSAGSTQAISALRSSLEDLLTGSLGSSESAASVVYRLFSSPSEDEAKRSSDAARVANAAEFGRLVADGDGVKNSGVAGSLRSGTVVVDGWMPDVCDSDRLIERPGGGGQRLGHTWHLNSFLLGSADGGASAPPGEAGRLSREDLMDDDQARRRLDEALLLNHHGVTDGKGRKQAGYNMPSKEMEAVGRAVSKATLIATVSEGGVRAMLSMNGAGGVADPDLLTMFVEEGWGHLEVTEVCRQFFLSAYDCSFCMGDEVGSAASAHIVYAPDNPAGSSFLLYATGGQTSYLACAEMGLLKMGKTAGVFGAGEDATFAHFLGRFGGVELFLAALAAGDGRSVDFTESCHGALYAHGAASVVRSLKSSAGADVAYVDATTGKLVDRKASNAVRITEGGAALKGAASAGVNSEARGPNGPTGGGWDGHRDLMDDHRFPAGHKVKIKGEEVALPEFTLRCGAKHETPLSFLVEKGGLVIAEERYCSGCTAELRLAAGVKATLKAADIDALSRATCQRRRRANKLIMRP